MQAPLSSIFINEKQFVFISFSFPASGYICVCAGRLYWKPVLNKNVYKNKNIKNSIIKNWAMSSENPTYKVDNKISCPN